MKLTINRKKIDIFILYSFIDKFKSFKFKLDPIENGICFIKKKYISTYFFCQNVTIIFADKDNKVIKYYTDVKSEKRFFQKNSFYIYVLPNIELNLKIGNKLNVKLDDNEKEYINKYL